MNFKQFKKKIFKDKEFKDYYDKEELEAIKKSQRDSLVREDREINDLPPELLAKALNTLSYQMAISVGREPFIQGELLTEEDVKNIFK